MVSISYLILLPTVYFLLPSTQDVRGLRRHIRIARYLIYVKVLRTYLSDVRNSDLYLTRLNHFLIQT